MRAFKTASPMTSRFPALTACLLVVLARVAMAQPATPVPSALEP